MRAASPRRPNRPAGPHDRPRGRSGGARSTPPDPAGRRWATVREWPEGSQRALSVRERRAGPGKEPRADARGVPVAGTAGTRTRWQRCPPPRASEAARSNRRPRGGPAGAVPPTAAFGAERKPDSRRSPRPPRAWPRPPGTPSRLRPRARHRGSRPRPSVEGMPGCPPFRRSRTGGSGRTPSGTRRGAVPAPGAADEVRCRAQPPAGARSSTACAAKRSSSTARNRHRGPPGRRWLA